MARTSGQRMLDVEDVVRWACGELARKRPAPSEWRPPTLSLPRLDAMLVGRWERPPGYPKISPMFAGGFAAGGTRFGAAPDADALLVEAAIGGLAGGMAGFAAPEELAEGIGFDVDASGAFAAALGQVAGQMFAHGRLGTRPEIRRGLPRVRIPKGDGRMWQTQCMVEPKWPEGNGDVERLFEAPVKAYRDRHGATLCPAGSFCRLEWDPDPQSVINDRADYLVWRLALDELTHALSGRLAGIAALPTAAAMAPWLGQKDGDKPIDLFRPGAERVYSAQQLLCLEARRDSRARRPIPVARASARRPARVAAKRAAGT
jgi:hypothetical protein